MSTLLEEDLREACAIGDLENVKRFIEKDMIPINSQNKMNGWTPLHWGVQRNHHHIVKYLMDSGADPNITNNSGKTPIELVRDSNILSLFKNVQLKDHEKEKDQDEDKEISSDLSVVERVEIKENENSSDQLVETLVPNYIQYPTTNPSWILREKQTLLNEKFNSLRKTESTPIKPKQSFQEIIIFHKDRETIVGGIYYPETFTVDQVMKSASIQLELPEFTLIYRDNGDFHIPISNKQMKYLFVDVFKPKDCLLLK